MTSKYTTVSYEACGLSLQANRPFMFIVNKYARCLCERSIIFLSEKWPTNTKIKLHYTNVVNYFNTGISVPVVCDQR